MTEIPERTFKAECGCEIVIKQYPEGKLRSISYCSHPKHAGKSKWVRQLVRALKDEGKK